MSLTKLTSINKSFEWTRVEQGVFNKIKQLVDRDTLLTYPYFNETFKIRTDASALRLGAVISQTGKPITFYSKTLTAAPKQYIIIERELLSIVKILKEFIIILRGQKLRTYTDFKNLLAKCLIPMDY